MGTAPPRVGLSDPSPTLLGMDMKDWLRETEREIGRRVDAAIARGGLTARDEMLEYIEAPSGDRYWFSIRGALEDRQLVGIGEGSQDPGWMEPA